MHLGQEVLSDEREALAREWLLANGRGGSASGTAAGVATRRQQAWLVAGSNRPLVHLLRLDERIVVEGHASGPVTLEEFRLDPWPVWVLRTAGCRIERSLFLVQGHDALAVSWNLLEGPGAKVTASPLLVARELDALQNERHEVRGVTHGVPGRVRIETFDGCPALTLWHNGAFLPARVWVRGVEYADDREGAAPAAEDAFVPGYVEGRLAPDQGLHVVVSLEEDLFRALASEERLGVPPPRNLAGCIEALGLDERARRARWRTSSLEGADFTARQAAVAHGGPNESAARAAEPLIDARDAHATWLADALRAGIVRRGMRTGVVSLPNGEERGADTLRCVAALISLRAFDAAWSLLEGAVEFLDEGLAPERFDAEGLPLYGDPEPSLWLIAAADLYARRSADGERLQHVLFPALEGVMQAYRQGTRGVRVDGDGLLATGAGDDVRVRADLNALWYHALVAMAQLARLVGRKENGAFYLAWAREHQMRFHERMWDDARGALHEAIGPNGPEGSLTPSQLLAVSLPPALLPPDRAARLVETVERELFTPFGLRERAGSEIVRPEWLGAFVTSWLRVRPRDGSSPGEVRAWYETLADRARRARGGHVPESFRLREGTATAEAAVIPSASVSTLAAAELLRAWIEEVEHGASSGVEVSEPLES